MEILCTRPNCGQPINQFSDLDDPTHLKTAQQKYCTTCGMHLILGGRYLVEKLLGQGGFGAAFLARDRYTPTMRKCVVKQFQPVGNLDDDQLALAQGLFEREAHVLERIGNRHQHIPDLFAFFPLIVPAINGSGNSQYFYLVQEYIEGEDLEQELERQGKFSETAVLEILGTMLEVLDFVHAEGTIHRDIKPSNIMRRKDGLLYLLDFGAVKEVAVGVAANSSSSKRSTGIYSPGYAPPEQMRGAQVFPATDLYALAVTCIVLLTNESPETLFDAYSNTWQWKRFAKISPSLTAILDHMLQSSPGDRPPSAKEVLKTLQIKPPPFPATKKRTLTYSQLPPQPTSIQPKAPPIKPTRPQTPAPKKQKQTAPTVAPTPRAIQTPQPNNGDSLVKSLLGVAFIGFEGTLLYFIATGIFGWNLGLGLWGASMGGILFGTIRKTLPSGLVLVIAPLSIVLSIYLATIDFLTAIVTAVMIGASLVVIFLLFTVIYRLLQKVL
ncbi:serine/threonine protein kinase [[Leptolyngbya] sp. PCC 7376]|uniref:protein kinase domain-containing protein n=1 Tax=[Leptolyngbya] sp. PCC 7376 TaxID=111781 RepID=UPI00029EFFFB|nr:protein kinase [[Leptolyngbya] sp. PCC 7376]AFY37050.1 serine/threonine protein kinase [[Leptolyngbya] sp. PCC 7376]